MTSSESEPASVATDGLVIHWAGLYDHLVGLVLLGREPRFRAQILEAAALTRGERVLDVGCGTGTLSVAAARAVGPGGAVYGIDPASEMISRARRKALAADAPVEFQTAVIEALPFEDDSMDVVVSSLVFHHLPPHLQTEGLSEIRRVLRPEGRLIIVDFFGHGPAVHRLASFFRRGKHEHAAPAEQLSQRVRAAGFARVATRRLELGYAFALTASGA